MKPNNPGLSWKPLIFPQEHGGWVMTAECILAALLIHPSWSGIFVGVFGVLAFFFHHPLEIYGRDRREGKAYVRTGMALSLAGGYAAVMAVLLLAAAWRSGPEFFVPLALALPLFAVQMFYSISRRARTMVPEICGSAVPGAVAASILAAGGWSVAGAMAVWFVLALRGVTSVVYVRNRLKQDKRQGFSRPQVVGAHAVALGVLAAMNWRHMIAWPAVVSFAVLFVRAVHGVSPLRGTVRAQTVGFQEMAFGLFNSVMVAAGFKLL